MARGDISTKNILKIEDNICCLEKKVNSQSGESSSVLGEVKMYAGQTAPTNWHFCDGTELLIASHPDLNTVIGTTFGGDGVTTIALPDMTDRMPIGVSGTRVLGTTGGSETVTLTEAQLPAHNHTAEVNAISAKATTNVPSSSVHLAQGNTVINFTDTATDMYTTGVPDTTIGSVTVGNTGSGDPVNTISPFLSLNFIIRVL